ncbi:MAG: FctA domain-containing protein [Clostridiales bacterium]|nr:FctA domain-containing protein [Clostridiales bacterium]
MLDEAAKLNRERRRRQKRRRIVGILSAVVVFCTTYALILPAITMGNEPVCGLEEHTHGESCWEISQSPETRSFSCLDGVHVHSGECRGESGELSCGYADFLLHEHTGLCFDGDGVLVCPLEEIEAHTHGSECYESRVRLSCGLEEDCHVHGEDCYAPVRGELICGIEESAEHTHGDECYAAEKQLVCTIEENPEGHVHGEECFSEELELVCGKDELIEHKHTDECFDESGALCCGMTELLSHVHSDACVVITPGEEQRTLVCGKEEHTHTAECYPPAGESAAEESGGTYLCGAVEHTHGDECFDESGLLSCTIEEHSHTAACSVALTDAEKAEVERVIALIAELPGADEVEAAVAAFENAEDYDGEEAYYAGLSEKCRRAYDEYVILTDDQKLCVANSDRLMELEFIWSSADYVGNITSDRPTVIASASTSAFIELNLYDYKSNINEKYKSNNKYPGFQWNGGAYVKSTYDRHTIDYIDFGNSLITDLQYGASSSGGNGRSVNAKIVGTTDGSNGAINRLDVSSYGVTNRPIGMSLNSSITDTSADVLSRTLGSDGYPALPDGTSLSYLFKDGAYAVKQNTASIDGLFIKDEVSGEYSYNSRLNHAQYAANRFTLYNQIITPNFITYPFGNFLPLNDITSGENATQVGKITSVGGYVQAIINDLVYSGDYSSNSGKQQLVDMLAKYRSDLQSVYVSGGTAWTVWSAKNAIVDYFTASDGDNPSDDTSPITNALLNRLYNIDWDVETNFFFGMEMKMNFIQPKGGMTGNDTDGDGESDYPMVFYFTGDDDVWVYIDDVLFLDLSGIHRHVGGKIDFVNGKVYYYYLDTANTGDVSSTPYKTYTFAEILSAAGKSTAGLNSAGTFRDYTAHSFKFYYMERGSGSSVCRLNFNFPLLRQNSISVEKEVESGVEILGNPDYGFQVLKADQAGNKTGELFIAAGTSYTLYDENGNEIGTGTTDSNGVFRLKAGQRAEFTGIKENAGKYYVRELLEGTVLEQYGSITVSGESTTTSNNVTVGSDTFTGMDSPVKDMSDGATSFRFTNTVDSEKLGNLSISKTLTEYSARGEVRSFDIQVAFDGELLPAGTEYTVGDVTKTVTSAGIITIAAGETAEFSNVLAGTVFAVQETSGSAEGYTVTYTDSGGYTITVNDGVAMGVIKTSANVQLVVANAEKGATVTIPGTKTLKNPDGTEHVYTFRLDEVTDETGAALKEGGLCGYEATAAVTDAGTGFEFGISYAMADIAAFPQKFYYRITEAPADDSLPDSTVYVVEVTVDKAGNGISAEITGMWQNGEKTGGGEYIAGFENTLAGSLTLEKTVKGGDYEKDFTFEIALSPGDFGGELPDSYPAVKTDANGIETETAVSPDENGKITVLLRHGEKLEINGIPVGAEWSIKEYSDGYRIDTEVTEGGDTEAADESDGLTGGRIEAADNTKVVYTNTAVYELPETGGAGTGLYTLCGLPLAAAPLVYGLRRKVRKKKGG